MNQNQLDRFYLLYVLLVTILILGFSWVIFESKYIYGQNNVFAATTEEFCPQTGNSLPETAKEIIDITKHKIQYHNSLKKFNMHVEEI